MAEEKCAATYDPNISILIEGIITDLINVKTILFGTFFPFSEILCSFGCKASELGIVSRCFMGKCLANIDLDFFYKSFLATNS